MTHRDPDMIRVSKRQLRKVLADLLAPKRVAAVVELLEAAPEGEIPRGKPSDESRTLAHMDFAQPKRRQA